MISWSWTMGVVPVSGVIPGRWPVPLGGDARLRERHLEQVGGRQAAVRPPGLSDLEYLLLAWQGGQLGAAPDGLAERQVAGQHDVGPVKCDDQHAVYRPRPDAGDGGETVQDLVIRQA